MRSLLLCLLVGCLGPEEGSTPVEYPLAGFPAFAIQVRAGAGAVSLDMSSGNGYESPPCPRLPDDFEATLDGQRMSVERGHVEDEGLDFPEYVCTEPSAYTTAHGQLLRLADASAEYLVDLGDITDYRSVTLASTTLTRGLPFDITWSSMQDLDNTGTVRVYLGSRLLVSEVVDGTIRATMPTADEQAPGNGSLTVEVNSTRPCSYSHCSVSVSNERLTQIVIE